MSDNESRPGRAAQSPASEGAVMTPGLDATAALAAALAEAFPVTKEDGTLKPPEESMGWAEAIIAALEAADWYITSAPEAADSEVAQSAERTVKGSPLGEVAGSSPVLGVQAAGNTADDPVSAQAAPERSWLLHDYSTEPDERARWLAAIEQAAVREALEGLRAEVDAIEPKCDCSDDDMPYCETHHELCYGGEGCEDSPEPWLRPVLALIDARLAALK